MVLPYQCVVSASIWSIHHTTHHVPVPCSGSWGSKCNASKPTPPGYESHATDTVAVRTCRLPPQMVRSAGCSRSGGGWRGASPPPPRQAHALPVRLLVPSRVRVKRGRGRRHWRVGPRLPAPCVRDRATFFGWSVKPNARNRCEVFGTARCPSASRPGRASCISCSHVHLLLGVVSRCATCVERQ